LRFYEDQVKKNLLSKWKLLYQNKIEEGVFMKWNTGREVIYQVNGKCGYMLKFDRRGSYKE